MFTILIDSQKQVPIYQQIYEYIKEEIKNGNLVYQDKLPSSRGLASHIAVSRNTVDLAYSQLVSEDPAAEARLRYHAEIAAALKGVDPSATTEEMIRYALRAMVLKN